MKSFCTAAENYLLILMCILIMKIYFCYFLGRDTKRETLHGVHQAISSTNYKVSNFHCLTLN